MKLVESEKEEIRWGKIGNVRSSETMIENEKGGYIVEPTV